METQAGAPGITVIVLSYNRPKMLREALTSIVGAAEVILCDDGSDFPVDDYLQGFVWPNLVGCDLTIIRGERRPLWHRLTAPRVGALINRGLAEATQPIIAYLCDDDLFHPGWLPAVAAAYARRPDVPMVRGDWYEFEDGQEPTLDRLWNGETGALITGNFAHLRSVFEQGGRWDERAVALHDGPFLAGLAARRLVDIWNVPHIGAIAGWRRLHPHNAAHVVGADWQYQPDAARLFGDTWLERTIAEEAR